MQAKVNHSVPNFNKTHVRKYGINKNPISVLMFYFSIYHINLTCTEM